MFRSLFTKLFLNSMLVLFVAITVFGIVLGNLLSLLQYQTSLQAMKQDAQQLAQNYAYLRQRQITSKVMADSITASATDSEVWFIGKNGLNMSITGFSDEKSAVKAISEETQQIAQTVAETGNTMLLEGTFDEEFGLPIVTLVVPLAVEDTVEGSLFLHRHLSVMRASLTNVYSLLWPSILMSVGVGLMVAYAMTRRIARPLTLMSAAAKKLAKGDMSVHVDESETVELNELASAFNAMVKDLSQVEQVRKDFVANVSHELRSPITSIAGYVQGMLDGTIPKEEHPKYMQVVFDETTRLKRLINDLLDLSRIESGSVPLNRIDFELNELLRRILIKFEGRLDSKNMDVDLRFAEEDTFVNADVDRIEQVVSNLIDNSIKFCGQYGRLMLTTARKDSKVFVTVADDGAGISKEDIPHLFDRFYKADKAHTVGLGTGLGLSIVKKIIDQHGEEITVESQEGSGASFTFTLTPSTVRPVHEKPVKDESDEEV